MSATGGRPLISFRTLVVALCVAFVAMWVALGQPAAASDLATTVPIAATADADHHAGDHGGVPHAHSSISDLLNIVLGIGHAHDLGATDGHHHHTSGDAASVLPAHERADNLPAPGSLVRWAHADPFLTGRPSDSTEHPPKR